MPPLDSRTVDLHLSTYDREFLRSLRIAVPNTPAEDADEPYVAIGTAITLAGLIGLFLSLKAACSELL